MHHTKSMCCSFPSSRTSITSRRMDIDSVHRLSFSGHTLTIEERAGLQVCADFKSLHHIYKYLLNYRYLVVTAFILILA